MEEKTLNDSILMLRSKLDLVMKRLDEMEHRLSNLERKIGGGATNLPVREPVITTGHSYLKRVIKSALNRYQGE